jgi:hypothetical protein
MTVAAGSIVEAIDVIGNVAERQFSILVVGFLIRSFLRRLKGDFD